MRVAFVVAAVVVFVVTPPAPGQDTKSTNVVKSTSPTPIKAKKATKAVPPVIFEAHNEGAVEGPIYGDENLVSVTIDATGIQYHEKASDKSNSIPWAQVAGWQANNFTSTVPGRGHGGPGDFGIGIYQGVRYFSFRTRNARDYADAIRILRVLASLKERPGIG